MPNDGKTHYIIQDAGVWYTREQMATLKWAMFLKKLGVTNEDSLVALYKEVHGDSIQQGTKRALSHGFNGSSQVK